MMNRLRSSSTSTQSFASTSSTQAYSVYAPSIDSIVTSDIPAPPPKFIIAAPLARQQVDWDAFLPQTPSSSLSEKSQERHVKPKKSSLLSKLRISSKGRQKPEALNIELTPISPGASNPPKSPPPVATAFAQFDMYNARHVPGLRSPEVSGPTSPNHPSGRTLLSAKSVPDFCERHKRKQQTQGTLKLVVQPLNTDDGEITVEEAETVFTTVTETSVWKEASEREERVPAYGRGGAGRTVAVPVISDVASMSSGGSRSSTGSGSGKTGGKAFVDRILQHTPGSSNLQRKSMASSTESLGELRRRSIQIGSRSPSIKSSGSSLPAIPEFTIVGRGGAGSAPTVEEVAVTKTRREQILADARKKLAEHEAAANASGLVTAAYGRGGAARAYTFGKGKKDVKGKGKQREAVV